MTSRHRNRIMTAILIIAFAAIATFAAWRWAIANQSVATLDTLDGFFTGGAAQLAAGPVAYGEHAAQRLFVHRTPDSGAGEPRPVILFLHGGGWHSGDPQDYAFVARNLAPHGFVVAVAGYRLGVAGRYPAMLEDSARAVRWVVENIADHGGDPARLYLMGHSAGAYNAAMLALDRQWLGREGLADGTVDGVVGLAGPYDFLPLDSESTIAAFGHAAPLSLTQPVELAHGAAPPMLLASGTADTTVRPRNSEALAAAIRALGGPVETAFFEDMTHEGIIMKLARPFDRDARVKNAVLGFLRELESTRAASLPVQAKTD